MLNLTSKYGKLLISISIGIGLGLFLFASILFGDIETMLFSFIGLVAFMMVILWFLIERKRIGFGVVASISTIVLIPIATIPLYFIYMNTLGIFLQAVFDDLALLFLGSGFLAIGFIGVYIQRKPKKLGFSFLILGFLFLIGVPLVNGYQVMVSRFGSTWIATPYEGYTIPLILVSVAFFLLGCVSFLHMKFLAISKSLRDTTVIKQERIEGDFTHEKK